MPELPEVEHARRCLLTWLGRAPLREAAAAPSRLIPRPGVLRALRGKRLQGVERKGKQLLLCFEGGTGLAVHLGMSGRFRRLGPEEPLPAHARLILRPGKGGPVVLIDPRMFGHARVGAQPALRAAYFAELGPDALDEPPGARALQQRLGKSRRPIKIALLDQRALAGLGNIQASEILFRAALDPRTPAASLSAEAWRALSRAMRASLRFTLRALAKGQGSYLQEGGEVVSTFLVYDRDGAPCPRCGSGIARMLQGGRATYHCTACQVRVPSEPRPSRARR